MTDPDEVEAAGRQLLVHEQRMWAQSRQPAGWAGLNGLTVGMSGSPVVSSTSNSALYKLCTLGGEMKPHADFIWLGFSPSKVKFFIWLLVRGRIQSRSNLLRKKILDAADSGFWNSMGIAPDPDLHVSAASDCTLPAAAPSATAITLHHICLWYLWKHRNGVVFKGLAPSLSKSCRDDVILWRARLTLAHRQDVELWLTFFLSERP
ncbi:hypothetical protein QYE76_014921 [Lolium multiflorum]|uniref:Reverse transcriptase zinc-binding domain-containing protein n=1 Tax=Lolium multiflorum TaxID=4521 RepID=A0AAD8X962_LOLMU|nr:hypothetical protein QYE76_014921 [Lolium multiflorum]